MTKQFLNGWTYERMTIESLKDGSAFYRMNPIEHDHNVLPDYKVNLDDNPDTLVWVCYPTYQKNPFLSERGMSMIELAVVFGIVALIAWGMSLQAHNGADVFTAGWNFLSSIH